MSCPAFAGPDFFRSSRPVRIQCRRSPLPGVISMPRRPSPIALFLAAAAIALFGGSLSAQTAQQKKPAPQPRAPQQKPPAPAPKAAEPVRPPAPPPPEDVHFKTVYTNGDQKTETVTFIKGQRE